MSLSVLGLPLSYETIAAKTPANYPDKGVLVTEFDVWRESYAALSVSVLYANTNNLMPIYSDVNLTQRLDNPQILLSKEDSLGNTFGKFAQSVYAPFPYQCDIANVDQTGINQVPIYDLANKDASYAVVTTKGANRSLSLREHTAKEIYAIDFGEFGESPSTNTTTLTNAISAAALNGGGEVYLPAGTIPFLTLTVPEDVVLVGSGRDVTILQSESATKIITFSGDNAGLRDLMLDGLNVNTGSIGIYGVNLSGIRLDNVDIRRFDIGAQFLGGSFYKWRTVNVYNCTRNVRLLGDTDDTGSGNGDEFCCMDWVGGSIRESTSTGLELSMVDDKVRHNNFSNIDIKDNVGSNGAVRIYGASNSAFRYCQMTGNTTHFWVSDHLDEDLEDYQVDGLEVRGGYINGGNVIFDGLCQNVNIDKVEIQGVEFQLNVPESQILLIDCKESGTTFDGDTTKISRFRTNQHGDVKGTTTDATAVIAWKRELKSNEVVLLEVSATAEQRNGADYAAFKSIHAARRAPSTINYDAQTANFTVGNTIVGATSGATAVIAADSDSGTTGTLSLAAIEGEFVDNEIIAESDGSGSARVNGYIAHNNAALIASATAVHVVGSNAGGAPTGWALGFSVSVGELNVTVKGASGDTVVWNVSVREVAL